MSFHHHPEFHRIIMQDKKLRVPKKYVEKYWKGISNPIFLIFPNGVEQKVFWKEESNGDVCFEKNWENFAKPLKYGSLLTFKHIGGPYFKVKIFGFNAVEINYSNIKAVEDNEEDVEGAAAKEVIDLSEDEFDDETDDEFEEQPQRRTSKRKVHVESFSNRGGMAKKVKKCSTSEAFNASDIDENPFFEVKMTNCYANGHFMMVPSEFSREHLNNFVGTAFLQVGKNRPMKVNMKFDFSNRRSTISRGWKAFRVCLVREFWRGGEGRERYNLQVNDDCEFVIIQRRPLVFTVVIERAAKGPSPKKLHGWRQVRGNLWKKEK
ncbi:B3 domain-containing transcription factor VRN1 [Trifolium repens]|nr:B3 domain-containing transcription factor VRN1 [Trifolium repens]